MRIKKIILLITVMFSLTAACNGAFAAEKKGVLVSFWERIKAKWSAKKVAEPVKEAPVVQERLKPVAPVKEITPTEEIKTVVPTTTAKEGIEEVPLVAVKSSTEGPAGTLEEIDELDEVDEYLDEEEDVREIPYTKEQMVEVIARRLKSFPQILYMIPGLQKEEIPGGEPEYYFLSPEKVGGKPVILVELGKKTLFKIFVRVNNEATRLQTERLMQQLQQQQNLMQQLQQQQNIQRQQQIIQQQQQLNQQRAQQQQQPPPAPPQTRR